MSEEPRHRSCAAHSMPLVAQPSGVEAQGMGAVGSFANGLVPRRDEAGAAVRGGEHAVSVEPRAPGSSSLRKRPLLRPAGIEQRVREPRDVEIAAARGFAVLVEYLFRA